MLQGFEPGSDSRSWDFTPSDTVLRMLVLFLEPIILSTNKCFTLMVLT